MANQTTLSELTIPTQRVPVLAECDVLVCGGGPAGIAAAISAARRGASVILLERWPSVGGMATNALVRIWHTSDRTKEVIFGLVREAVERGGRWVRRRDSFPSTPETYDFEPEGMRVVFHRMLDDARVRTICNLMAVESIIENGRIRGVLVDTKTGRKAVLGRIVIDATGDGDVAANAGLPFEFGRAEDGLVQGMTMMFCLLGVDAQRAHATDNTTMDAILRKARELRDAGRFPPFEEFVMRSILQRWSRNHAPYNMAPVSGNPLDEEELSRLSALARERVYQFIDFWRREMPGYERADLEQTAHALGIRESRRIRGLKTLTKEMVVGAVKQPDALGHGFWMIDIHDPKGSGHTTWIEQDRRAMPPVGESYHIPLGMCLNDRVPNLAVVGRCASSTHEGHASVRLQTHCMIMGQGVGTCAALALNGNVDMTHVDVRGLQKQLRADGVYIEDVPLAK
jgi:hypothetical protein